MDCSMPSETTATAIAEGDIPMVISCETTGEGP